MRLGVPASTVHRVLVRLGLNRLVWLDRPTGEVIRRIHTERCGELVHLDVKKLGRIPPGGGWRSRGRGYAGEGAKAREVGYAYIHSAIDAHSRLAYSEVLDDERGLTAAGFWARAHRFFADHHIDVEAVLTDNGACYRSRVFAAALDPIEHRRIRPRRPQTNGKVERFNRTLLEEWAYIRDWTSETDRVVGYDRFMHFYNQHRSHGALGWLTPIATLTHCAGDNVPAGHT